MDSRIGKHGETKPTHTLMGRLVGGQVTITRDLGGGYYVIVDVGHIPEYEALIEELRGTIKHEPKRAYKQDKNSGETDNTV